jgi:polysaccharide biosynthesis transport protein
MTQPSPYFIRRNPGGAGGEPIETPFRQTFHDEDERALDLLQYWITLKKHRWLIAAVATAITLVVMLRVSMMTPLYTAEATILLKPGTPQLLQVRNGESGASTSMDVEDPAADFVKTQCEILRSRSLASYVVLNQGLAQDPDFVGKKTKPGTIATLKSSIKGSILGFFGVHSARKPLEDSQSAGAANVNAGLVGAYLGALQVKPVTETDLVKIIFTTTNPGLSAKLANAHAHAYIREGIELHTQANAEAERFLREKLVELKEKLEKSELALNNYRRDKGIIPGLMSMDGKETVVIDRLSELSKELTSAQVARIGLEAEVEQINKSEFDEIPEAMSSAGVSAIKTQMAALDGEYAAMSQQFKPDYPPLAQLQGKRQELQRRFRAELKKFADTAEASYRAAKIKEGSLQEEMNKQRAQALSLNDAAVGYTILQREVDTNRDLYNSVLQRMKDVGLAAESQSSNIVVLDEAEVPGGPSSPHKTMATLQAMAFGLALGIALAFLIEYQDKTLKTPDEVEFYLRLPNLAAVPSFSRPDSRTFNRARLDGGSSKSVPAVRREIAGSLSRYSVIGEAYRALRTALMLSRAGAPPKTILFTSAANSEGKTVSAINTAVVFAHTGARVVLVDVDLRRPRCHKVLGVENHLGLTEVLAGTRQVRDLVRTTDIDGLALLSAGSIPPNPSELVGSEKMRETLAYLAGEFDLIVLDSPPLMPVTDAMLLSTMVDGVVLVVNSSKTAKQHVKAACARLEFARAKVFGVLLNEVDVNSPHYKHYRQYYGGYGDYHPYKSDTTDASEPPDEFDSNGNSPADKAS